jgi:DNA-directed RNA polymerase specialized sigma24 family protein
LNGAGFEQVAGREPTPEFALEMADTLRHLLERLNDETLRQIVNWKLAHLSNQQIADQQRCSVRSIERKLEQIRELCEEELKRE